MRFIPSAFHGVLDYAVAATLLLGPVLLGFEGVARVLAMAGGAGLLIYSLVTDYSLSARNLIPFRVHLVFDFMAALVLVAAPFVFGFGGLAQAFYMVIGLAVIAVVLTTKDDTQMAAAA